MVTAFQKEAHAKETSRIERQWLVGWDIAKSSSIYGDSLAAEILSTGADLEHFFALLSPDHDEWTQDERDKLARMRLEFKNALDKLRVIRGDTPFREHEKVLED